MSKYLTFYSRHFQKTFVQTTKEYFWNWRGWVGSIVTSVLTVYYLYLDDLVDIMNDELLVLRAILLASLTWAAFLFVFNFLKNIVDEHLYILPRANKFTWEDVRITAFPYPLNSPFSFGLIVENLKPYNMQSVSCKLIYLINTYTKNSLNFTDGGNWLPWEKDDKNTTWSSINIEKNIGKKNLVVTQHNSSEIWIPTNVEPSKDQPKTGYKNNPASRRLPHLVDNRTTLEITSTITTYAFEIEFNCQIDGYKLSPNIFKGILEYNGESGISTIVETRKT